MKSFGHFFFPTPEMGVNWGQLSEKIGYTQRTQKSHDRFLVFPLGCYSIVISI